jgi:hypothetical protein
VSTQRADPVRLSEADKQRRIIRTNLPAEARGEVLRAAIHKMHAEMGRICGTCGEWPEFCSCEPCCCPEAEQSDGPESAE